MKQRWNRVWSRLSRWPSALGSLRQKHWSLFPSVLFWVLLSLLAYTLLGWVWGTGAFFSRERAFTSWRIGAETDPLDRVKVTLTALGGVGAVGYLVIKYRERASLERGEADERLLRAVQQLGDSSPQVRIAGVYALADVADTFEGSYHQRVVDILCGYLRTDRLLKDSNGETLYTFKEDGLPDYGKPLSNDGAVESTILSVLANHLKAESRKSETDTPTFTPGPWSHCTIDLHGTTFTENVNLSKLFLDDIDLSSATFTNNADFIGTTFTTAAYFSGTTFTNDADFRCTTFTNADFSDTTFTIADFSDTTFTNSADFMGTTFTTAAYFSGTTFTDAYFLSATFTNKADFRGTTLEGDINFKLAIFNATKRDDRTALKLPKSLDIEDGIPVGARWGEFNEEGKLVRVLPTGKENQDDSLTDDERDSKDEP